MNNPLLFLLLWALFAALPALAQNPTPFPTSANQPAWWVRSCGNCSMAGGYNYDVIYYMTDTVEINGKWYSEVRYDSQAYNDDFTNPEAFDTTYVFNQHHSYVRNEGDRALILYETDTVERVLYDFGLEVGDVINSGFGDAIVVDVDMVAVNGILRKRIAFELPPQVWGGMNTILEWVEGIGAVTNHPFSPLEPVWVDIDMSVVFCQLGEPCINTYGYAGYVPNPIYGMVYYDMNGDGQQDASEGTAQHIGVSAGEWSATTDTAGNFTLRVPSDGVYTVSATPPGYYYAANPPSTAVSVESEEIDPPFLLFGLQPTAFVPDLSVHVAGGNARAGFPTYFVLHYRNRGTATIDDAHLLFSYSEKLTLDSTSVPYDAYDGNDLEWNLGALPPNAEGSIRLDMTVSPIPQVSLGEVLVSTAAISPFATDAVQTDNFDVFHQTVSASFDPNDKLVSPAGYVAPDARLTYTIRFQNTGNDTAFRVVVVDTLSQWLDAAGVAPIAASHPHTFALKTSAAGKAFLQWTFDPISLPDSTTDAAASQGYILFSISPHENLAQGQRIHNDAGIYFDYNPAVITNQAQVTLWEADETVLDVRLLDFGAWLRDDGRAALHWRIEPQPTDDYVVVQRADDGIRFEPLATFDCLPDRREYWHTDPQPLSRTTYYRLQTFDTDGSSDYSRVVAVSPDAGAGVSLRVADDGRLWVVTPDAPDFASATVTLADPTGRILHRQVVADPAVPTTLSLPAATLPPGIYHVVVQTGAARYLLNWVKTR